jgi:hypothetical protein
MDFSFNGHEATYALPSSGPALPPRAPRGFPQPPSNEEIEAAAQRIREQQGLNKPGPQTLGMRLGVSREAAQYLQLLEAKVTELESRLERLEQPAHMQKVERRG